jgi:hypothetical protein
MEETKSVLRISSGNSYLLDEEDAINNNNNSWGLPCLQAMKALRGVKGIVYSVLDLGTRRG